MDPKNCGVVPEIPTRQNMFHTGFSVHDAVPWKKCACCQRSSFIFKSPREFVMHLRDFHCTKEGGSFVCRYGPNAICPSLPLDGVSDRDYEDHVARDHVASISDVSRNNWSRISSRSSSRSNSPPQSITLNEPSIVQDQHKWTIYMSRVNLPALLNDPRLSRRETDFFSKTWGECFERVVIQPSIHIPVIIKDHFKKYLKRTAKRLQEHQKNSKVLSAEIEQSSHPKSVLGFSPFSAFIDQHKVEIDTIPKIFMHPGFSLNDPDTFGIIFPWTKVEISQQHDSSHMKASSKLLQEKLSHYLDLVEVQIAKQISVRSDAFFEAMTSHDELQDHMRMTCATIKKLRDKLNRLNSCMVEGPLRIMRISRSRTNHVDVYNKLKLMSTVHQTQPMIQQLLATNDFVGALDLIGTTQEVLSQELAGIHGFRHLGSQLAEMEKVIDKMLHEEFVRYAAADLNRPLCETGTIIEEEKLVAIILGMLRQHKYNFIDVYREEACATIKAIVKHTVIESVCSAEDGDDDSSGSLADQMRLLNYTEWMVLLEGVFSNMLALLNRIKAVSSVMQEVVSIAAGQFHNTSLDEANDIFNEAGETGTVFHRLSDSSTLRMSVSDGDVIISQAEHIKVNTCLRDMLYQVCDHAQDRCVKILVARSRDGFLEKLTSSEFVQLSRAVEIFVTSCGNICGRRSTSLRASLQSQASRFVSHFHEERRTKLSLILDNERWKQADVPVEFQELVNHIVTTQSLSLPERKTGPDKPEEYLMISMEPFAVVGTALLLLKMIVEYCDCVDDIPSTAPDIMTRLVELLKMFNSRTCQLILGAGALQLVGLKTITTKNLALASRCLQAITYFLPLVRRHFEERLPPKQATMIKHVDSVMKDYDDHIAELANKLVYIMENMLESNMNKWEVKAPMPSLSFRNICKQMTKLHEAVYDLLPQQQVLDIFSRIHKRFMVLLKGQLVQLGVTNNGGPQHALVMADVGLYTNTWRSLAGLQHIDIHLEHIWETRDYS